MRWHTAAYITAGVVFLVAEVAAALDSTKGNTLTENIRPFLRQWAGLHMALGLFLFWLLVHFLFRE